MPEPDGTPGTDPASAAAPPSRRSALMRSGFILGVLVVFLVILPRYIDYQEVAAAFQALTLSQFVIISTLGAFAWLVSGLVFCALIPGLSIVRGPTSWLILSGIGASVPFGPWNMGVLWVVVRGWGITNIPATSGIALYGVVSQLSRLFLPLFAVIVLWSRALSVAWRTPTARGRSRSSAQSPSSSRRRSSSPSCGLHGLLTGSAGPAKDRGLDHGPPGPEQVPDVEASIHRFRDQSASSSVATAWQPSRPRSPRSSPG